MIEDLPKLVELGALGVCNFILIFKGIGKMQQLTDSINKLVEKISTLENQQQRLELNTNAIEQRIAALENRFLFLEESIKNELRDIKLKTRD